MKRFLLCWAVLAAVSTPTRAAVIEFFDSTTFNATVPGVVTFDFETGSGFPAAPAPLDFIDATIDLSTSGGDSVVQIQDFGFGFGQAIGGSNGGAIDNFLPVVVVFTAPYFAVGFDVLDLTPNEFAVIQVVLLSGALTFNRTDPDGDFSTAPFFGFWSDEAIIGVRVWSANAPNDNPGARANLIDNLAVSRIAAPEPGSFLLLSLGLGVVGLVRRRRA